MKTKVVLWGENAKDEKVLIALQLRADDNMVDVFTFPEAVVNEEFSQKMMNEWRDDKEVEFPEGFTKLERELSITDNLLPEDLRVNRTDVISRAQTEWHFVVLSGKLNAAYQNELNDLREMVAKLEGFEKDAWDRLKEFWNKVQGQVQERNLFRGHADSLRDGTNQLFEEMKQKRKKLDEEFRAHSGTAMEYFMGAIDAVEKKATEGGRLRPLFDELVELQRKYRESTKMTREHRNKVWGRMDGAFKQIKNKLFGDQSNSNDNDSAVSRTQRRLNGLMAAIQKMERSVGRDYDDLEFQNRRIANSDGQLETQIRQAKLKMINERLSSKQEKLADMNKTKLELEEKIVKEKAREEKRKEQQARDTERKEKEAAAKAKIAAEMKAQQEALEVDEDKLKAAAQAFKKVKEPVIETAAATAAVVTEKVVSTEETPTTSVKEEVVAAEESTLTTLIDNAVTTAAAGIPAATATAETPVVEAAAPEKETPILEEVTTMVSETIEDVTDTAKAVASVVMGKVSEAIEEMRGGDEEE